MLSKTNIESDFYYHNYNIKIIKELIGEENWTQIDLI